MKQRRYLLLPLLLLAGCAGSPWQRDEPREVAAQLAAYERAAAMPTEDQRREYALALAAYERTPTDATRFNLALTMLLPRAAWRDDKRLQSLLAEIGTTPGPQSSARHDLAQLLLRLIAERQRKAEQLTQQLREERHRTEELQQKIESLRAIDRDMRPQRRTP